MRILRLFFLFSLGFYPIWSQAISVTAAGASSFSQTTTTTGTTSPTTGGTTTGGTTGGTTTTQYKLYGGYGNPANCAPSSKDGVNTCNSCTGGAVVSGTQFAACNPASIYENLALVITVVSDRTDINQLTVGASLDSSHQTTVSDSINQTGTVNGNTYTFTTNWQAFCNAFASGSACANGTFNDNTASTGQTLYFGPLSASGTGYVEYVQVPFIIDVINNTGSSEVAAASLCSQGVTPANLGACFFSMFPGDQKAYVDQFGFNWNPTAPVNANQVPLANVYALYATGTPGTEAQIVSTITNANAADSSKYQALAINQGAANDDPLSSYKITDLDNDSAYCFVLATQNATGNISYFVDTNSGETTQQQCTTPSEVFGVLYGKHCFVATVAFGSAMNEHVDSLRQFRDRYLMSFKLGRQFIHFYYTHGYEWASWIKHHPKWIPMARAGLWPLVFLVEILLKWGPYPYYLLLIAGAFAFVFPPLRRKWVGRGENV